ncbi:sensor histidine kinase [Streptomyces sp. YC504]|uniref:Sensor histidine kinase n=1 Tax=Streptomyces mesophilus TaxID=1775132 RepID=A0A6G4XBT4_9ACTN|nr:sensor histidine kinase [Streptomyces mesophilus]NGO75016.1 sensor histidine kinase [Streptomyces mesophilus]
MPGNLPVEEPARRLNGPAGPREIDVDVHSRVWLGWDAYFAVVWVGTVLFVVGGTFPAPLAVQLTACGLFVLLVPWYLWRGRPAMHTDGEDERAAMRYVVVATALFTATTWMLPESRLATFALVPQCFMVLRYRQAMITVALINILPIVGWAAIWRPEAGLVYFNGVSGIVTLVFSLVFGSWIIKVIEQSKERGVLIAELDASREEIAKLSAERGALAERERMSREIHDTLAQGFTSLLMLVQAVDSELEHDLPGARRHLALMEQTARQNLAEARALVAGRAPADLDDGSLADALRRLADRHHATLTVTGTARDLSPGLEVVALRSCQEALANVRKHAGPDADATVCLSYGEEWLVLSIRDTGCGFTALDEGYGLRGLRARAREVQGTAEVSGRPGEGTTVTVRLPLPRPARSTG